LADRLDVRIHSRLLAQAGSTREKIMLTLELQNASAGMNGSQELVSGSYFQLKTMDGAVLLAPQHPEELDVFLQESGLGSRSLQTIQAFEEGLTIEEATDRLRFAFCGETWAEQLARYDGAIDLDTPYSLIDDRAV
jgi:hypothetical protein